MAYRRQSNYGNQYGGQSYGNNRRRGGGQFKMMLIIAACFAAFSLFKYYSGGQYNEVLGEKQYVGGIEPEQEIALGLKSAPAMVQQHGGLHPSLEGQEFVKRVGQRLVENSIARETKYEYDFHLLADPNAVNAFALPGGQTFITYALFERLESEDQLAGVIGHEIGHVIARHGAERMAKQSLTQGLTGAAVIMAGDYSTAQAAQMIGNLVNMSYGREQELESDEIGVRLMSSAGYDPHALKGVMAILEKASGGSRQPEFNSTHPSPENRIERIDEAIQKWHR